MILNEQEALLEEARKRFPIGTTFISLFGTKDTVKRLTPDSLESPVYITENHEILVKCYGGSRLIYSKTLGWAGTI